MTEGHLRIGDAEREQAAAALGEHYAQGRLTTEEHAERLDQVWAARTRAELAPPFRDLPGPYGPVAAVSTDPARRPPYRPGGVAPFRPGRPSPLLLVLVVLLVVMVVTHVPVFLVGGLVLLFVLGRHRTAQWRRRWVR